MPKFLTAKSDDLESVTNDKVKEESNVWFEKSESEEQWNALASSQIEFALYYPPLILYVFLICKHTHTHPLATVSVSNSLNLKATDRMHGETEKMEEGCICVYEFVSMIRSDSKAAICSFHCRMWHSAVQYLLLI